MSDNLETTQSATTATTAARKLSKKQQITIVVAIVLLVVLGLSMLICYFAGAFDHLIYGYNPATYSIKAIAREDLSIHFMQLGNGYNGDSVYIKAGDTDILVDAGSRASSAQTIGDYVDRFCKDGKLEYVIVTHADNDHISGFVGTEATQGIFDRYECETIIEFARTNKKAQDYVIFSSYIQKRNAKIESGTNCYTALECYNNINGAKRTYQLAKGITLNILYHEYYDNDSARENNYSVCFMITQEYTNKNGDKEQYNYLFTGDLEKAGEESLVKYNPDLPQVDLFKAPHHGSRTSSNEVLLEVIQPKIVCVCCNTGSVENNTVEPLYNFPTQAFINRIAPYTDRVYATDLATVAIDEKTGERINVGFAALNGDIVFACTKGRIKMYFSNNATKLKDTTWFKESRTCPQAWG